MREISRSSALELQLVVTGMHLSPEFGSTYKFIESDGFHIDRKVEVLVSSDTSIGVSKSIGLGLIGFADAFDALKPDIILLLGDRFELLAAASAALVTTIPVAHIHGGEVTEGAFDDAIRHSITKMSQLHFTSTEVYRNRVIQLGEESNRVFNVGAPGLDNIDRLSLIEKEGVEEILGIKLGSKSLLVTWHPVTLEPGTSEASFRNILKVLDELENTKIVFTKANADTGGRLINSMIDEFVRYKRERAVAHVSLGQVNYLSVLREVTGILGNSSSGIIEAPSLGTGTVNIGDRQLGRVRSESVIDCEDNITSIKKALEKLFSEEFHKTLRNVENPYRGGDVAGKITEILSDYPLKGVIKKKFVDIQIPKESNGTTQR
jgi:GDP/UDP-N,N'-diacetylbacillosamine 2-epimerase (hydrolysing)